MVFLNKAILPTVGEGILPPKPEIQGFEKTLAGFGLISTG